jgi:hypothetical protein
MNVKLTPVMSYLVEIEGDELGRFDKVSEWEGMTKITSPKGTIIFESGTDITFDKIFSGIFSNDENTSKNFMIVKMSSNIIPSPAKVIDNIRMPNKTL